MSELINKAEKANAEELEDLRLKATQGLLREKAERTKQLEQAIEGIDKNLKQVEETDDIRLLQRLVSSDNIRNM